MKAFTLFLMMAVASVGFLGGYRLITGESLVSPERLGLLARADPLPRPSPSAAPVPQPTARPAPEPIPVPPTATPLPERPQIMVVGNTDGLGVYVRRTPNMADRLRAWPDRTRMEITGQTVGSDGRRWMKVRTPDGAEGYVPEQYLVDAP